MARLSLSSDFLADYAGLENRMQRKVSEVINTFEQLDAQQLRNLKGLNLEASKGSSGG